jgi:hypothetical protein
MTPANQLDLSPGRDPRKIIEDLERISKEAQGPYREKWAENVQHASGFLTDATRKSQVALVGGNLRLQIESNRYGAPSPIDVLRPTLSRFLGRHLALMGGWQVLSRTGTQEDKDQSESAERVLADKWDNGDLDVTCMEAFFFSQATSHGYILIEGDDTLSEAETFDIDGETRQKRCGDVVFSALSPFQIAIPPGSTSLEDAPALLVTQFVTPADFERRWGKIPENAMPRGARYEVGMLDSIIPSLDKGKIEVKRLFLRQEPGVRPLGEQYIIVGKAAAIPIQNAEGQTYMGTYNGGTPEKPKYSYPVVDFRDEPMHLGYWGFGRQSAARPIIKALCSIWSRLTHIASLPLVLALPEGSNIPTDELADVPFMQIEYNPSAGEPKFLTPGATEHLHKMIERCLFWIAEIYSQHESSRGVSSGSRFPAEAVRMLQEQDLLADSPAGHMALKAMTKVGNKVLGEGLRVWPEEYMATVLGPDNVHKRYVLQKKALQPGVDVRVIPGNEQPKSKKALMKELTEAVRWNIIPAKDARRIMGSPTKEDMYDTDAHHLEKIKMEEATFEKGQQVEPHWADNHELHAMHHERRAIERFATASRGEDQARRMHTELHHQVLQQQAEAEVRAALQNSPQEPAPAGQKVSENPT